MRRRKKALQRLSRMRKFKDSVQVPSSAPVPTLAPEPEPVPAPEPVPVPAGDPEPVLYVSRRSTRERSMLDRLEVTGNGKSYADAVNSIKKNLWGRPGGGSSDLNLPMSHVIS